MRATWALLLSSCITASVLRDCAGTSRLLQEEASGGNGGFGHVNHFEKELESQIEASPESEENGAKRKNGYEMSTGLKERDPGEPRGEGKQASSRSVWAWRSGSSDSPKLSAGLGKAVMSPSQQARQKEYWWDSKEALTLVLLEAEEDYEANLRKRKVVAGAGNPRWARDSPPPGAPPGPSPFTFIDRFFVAVYPCPLEKRLGAWGDGGKWVCMSHYERKKHAPVVVSVGSNGDTSFETAVYETFQVSSHTLDFSLKPKVAKQVSSLDFVHLYSVGLCGERDRDSYQKAAAGWGMVGVKFVTAPELLEMIGQDYVDIFKVDCEYCEYEMVRDLGDKYTRDNVPFGQILLELHRCADIELSTKLLGTLDSLGYRLFHTEINIYGASFNRWQFEVAFIHERHVKPRLA